MEQYPLLQTKLYIPPVRPELVSRPRLLERLNVGLGQIPPVFSRKLTLISAPAGFGKTTLVSEWVHEVRAHPVGAHRDAPLRVAWLSLDEGDNDPARFLAYLIAALRTIEANMAKGTLSALQSPGVADANTPPPAEAILTSLINEITTIPHRVLLVLDDYHLINAQPVHDALTFLIEHLPPQMHLVIATREDPHLPLARLRVRSQLTELRATDLRFTSSEAAEFLNQVMDLDLSAEDIAALETRTEGWIAGLHLAAISIQGRKDTSSLIKSFTGSHRFVLDYLIEEVLERQSEGVQTFLLRTSILDRLCGPLCDAVRFGTAESADRSVRAATARADAVLRRGASLHPRGAGLHLDPSASGQETLEYLEHANLFIVPLDEERRWYRYHHLFADLLRRRLRQTQLEQMPTLHLRASEWYEQNGFTDEAIEHSLRGDDFERAAHLIEEQADALWQRGEHAKLRRWLEGLPIELVFSKPQLCIYHAWHLFSSGQLDASEQSLQAAEEALGPGTDGAREASPTERDQYPHADRERLQGRVAATRSFIASHQGDVPGIIQHARQALEYLPEQDSAWRSGAAIALGDAYAYKGDMAAAYQTRLDALEMSKAAGNIYLILTANLKLAIILRQQGRLQRAIEICQQQMQLANESGISQTVVVSGLLATWGETLVELNNLDGAIDQAKKGVELAERAGDVAMLGWSYLSLTRALLSRGDVAAAQELIQKMEHIDREYDMPPWIANLMAAWQARIWLAQNELEAASQWVGERGLDTGKQPTPQHEMEYTVLARILLAQGRLDEATSLLQRLLKAAEAGSRTSSAIEILMLQALAFQAGGEPARAMTRLERALTLAEPGGFIRIFVDEGLPMAQLLYTAAARGMMSDYTARLLAAFDDGTKDDADAHIRRTAGQKREHPIVRPSSPARSTAEGLVEPLSERELDVLQLLAEGLTNQEIASRLFLALNTVKAHTRNIYGKLGVHSRTQAVVRARALGILPLI